MVKNQDAPEDQLSKADQPDPTRPSVQSMDKAPMEQDNEVLRIVGRALREADGRTDSHLHTWAWVLSRVKSIRADIPDSEILRAVAHLQTHSAFSNSQQDGPKPTHPQM